MVGKQHANHVIYLVILKIRDLDERCLDLREWNVIRHIANWYIKINRIIIYCANNFTDSLVMIETTAHNKYHS